MGRYLQSYRPSAVLLIEKSLTPHYPAFSISHSLTSFSLSASYSFSWSLLLFRSPLSHRPSQTLSHSLFCPLNPHLSLSLTYSIPLTFSRSPTPSLSPFWTPAPPHSKSVLQRELWWYRNQTAEPNRGLILYFPLWASGALFQRHTHGRHAALCIWIPDNQNYPGIPALSRLDKEPKKKLWE